MSSITYKQGKMLYPTFSYDQNKFIFTSEIRNINKGKNYFNQNARQNSSINRNKTPDTYRIGLLDSIWQDIEEIQDTGEEIDTDDYLDELSDYGFQPTNNFRDFVEVLGLSNVYKIADEKAREDFSKQYEKLIKPKILKQYGIKI